MLDLARQCFADAPDVEHIELGEIPEHEDVVLSMTTHRLVVVSGHIQAVDEAEVRREIALVIPRRLCVGDRPTHSALVQAGLEAITQWGGRQKASKVYEMLIETAQGFSRSLMRVRLQ